MRASDGTVAGVLLAAGSSTRMGRNKMLLELDGETVLRRAAKVAVSAGLDPVVVVTGHERAAAEQQVDGLGCTTVFNREHGVGIHSSVYCGIGNVPDTAGSAIVMLADMPFVTTHMIEELVSRYRNSEAPLVLSRYGGEVNAPPTLYDRSLFDELCSMQRRCGREVVKRHRHEAAEIDWPAAALRDLDTPGDYETVRAGLDVGSQP